MPHKLTFLGTSTSIGVPVIGCKCNMCKSDDPLLRRNRASIVIESDEMTVLVDSGPDLRIQSLRHGLSKVDHVLYTHAHLDHIAGFDELRAFCWHREEPLPLYSSEGCIAELKRIFHWAFDTEKMYKGYIRPQAIVVKDAFTLGKEGSRDALEITPIPVRHGSIETVGYLFKSSTGSIAYISDVKEIPSTSMNLIKNVDTLIIGCLREVAHFSHMGLEDCLSVIKQVNPGAALLTHISHEMDCPEVAKRLPENVSFSYDTQSLNF